MTLEEAQKTGVFWALIAAACTIAFLFTGLAFHQTSILGERGLSEAQSAGVWLPHFIAIAVGTLGAGWALDRFSPLVVVAIFLAFISAGAFSLFWVRPGLTAWIYGGLLGLGGGISRSAGGVVWPYYFGVKHLGAIQGRVFMFLVSGAAAAPLPFAFVFERYGSYTPIIVPLATFPLVLIVWVLRLRGQSRPVLESD
jgi:MFS family permease